MKMQAIFMLRLTLFFLLLISQTVLGQVYLDSTVNSSTKRVQFADINQLSIGSYGEAHFNKIISSATRDNGDLDFHRLILFTGYKFNKNLQFFSEIEFEHVQEVYIEQAFINYSVSNLLNFKAGMLIVPMGYVNEFHEPTLFNGVERPNLNKYLIPTTWRELGFGIHGILKQANLKYQLYVVNGFVSYNGSGKISGKEGLRSARQKGAEAIASKPALTGKLTYYGLNGIRIGLAGYYGMSESSLSDDLDLSDQAAIKTADSTIVGIGMLGLNFSYRFKKLIFRSEANYTSISNTQQYNAFTGADAAKDLIGYYTELSYNWTLKKNRIYPALVPFVRYENYDTHFKTDGNIARKLSYHREELIAGIGFQLTAGTIFKADYQWHTTKASPRPKNILNVGFGYWF